MQLVLLGIEPATPTSQVGEITKSSPRRYPLQAVGRVCLLLCLDPRLYWCKGRKYNISTNFPSYFPKLGCRMLALLVTLRPHLHMPGVFLQRKASFSQSACLNFVASDFLIFRRNYRTVLTMYILYIVLEVQQARKEG